MSRMMITHIIDYFALDNDDVIDLYDGENQVDERTTFTDLINENTEYDWMHAYIEYIVPYDHSLQIKAELGNITASRRVRSRRITASAWTAPNGKKYGKQTRRFPGKYLFTRRELKELVDSGIAVELSNPDDLRSMNYDILGISWNDTNGYRSGILVEDRDTGELYVGNTGVAQVARL